MKIALVTETYPPEVNGVAMTLGRVVGVLRQHGHQLQVVRPRQGQGDRPVYTGDLREILMPGLPLPRYQGLRFGLPCGRHLRRLWRQDRPDLVHVATEGPLGWSALRAARACRIPVSSSFHTNFHAYGRHYGFGCLKKAVLAYMRYFHNRTRATFAPTAEMCAILEQAGFRNTAVLGRGVDTRLYDPARRDRALRTRWLGEAEHSGMVVLYVGRIAAEKNLALAVRAFLAMNRGESHLRFVLVGDGPLRAKLEETHPEFVFCGAKSGEELAAHYASADVFLFPSVTETFGNVVTEAMASGLAVVAYDYAACRQHIRHGENGLSVPLGDEQAFVAAALQPIRNPRLVATLGSRARESTLQITWGAVVGAFEKDLQRIIFPKGVEAYRLTPGDPLP